MTSEVLANLNIITMPADEAAAKYAEYAAAVKRTHGAADRMMAKSFKWLAEGKGILNLTNALKFGGLDPVTFLPKLAVMRADMQVCYFQHQYSGEAFYSHSQRYFLSKPNRTAQGSRLQFHAPEETFDDIDWRRQPPNFRGVHAAPVPSIPPGLRPADALNKYVILWEVKEWKMVAPEDPILLRPISGDLYAVVAHWDLSPIEQMVMSSILGAQR